MLLVCVYCVFQAEDGIRDLVRSRGLGDVYKRQGHDLPDHSADLAHRDGEILVCDARLRLRSELPGACLLYTSDAADERSSVDLGGRRIIKKKKHDKYSDRCEAQATNDRH